MMAIRLEMKDSLESGEVRVATQSVNVITVRCCHGFDLVFVSASLHRITKLEGSYYYGF